MIRTALVAAALLLATSGVAVANDTPSFIWDSDAEAHPTHGRSGSWTPPEVFWVSEREDNSIHIYGEDRSGWEYLGIRLYRHDGQRITEGTHTDQRVHVVDRGLGWFDDGAEFTVSHIAYGEDGRISEFDAAIEHHYQDRPNSTLRAKLHYHR